MYVLVVTSSPACVFPGCSPSERLISRVGGQARSKTPNADMERSVYGADCASTPTYLNKVTPESPSRVRRSSLGSILPVSDRCFLPLQPMMLRDLRLGVEPDDGENMRRIGRSLSGTVVAPRRSRLTATRSFVSVTSCALLPPCGCAMKLHLPYVSAWHFTHCFPVLFSPRCLSRFFLLSCFFDFQSVVLSLLLFLSQRWSRLMSVPLLAYFLSSESLLLFHHYHLLHPPHHQHLLITTSLHCFTGKHCAELTWRYTCYNKRKMPLACLWLLRVYVLPWLSYF